MMPDDRQGASRIHDAMSARGLAGKRDYVRSLEQRRDEEALSLLVECLCDESGYLREMAESALLRMGERCGPALLPLLDQGLWFSRSSAARVLGLMGFGPAAGPLVRLTSDRVDNVVRDSCIALAELGRRGGLARIAWELHQLAPERRQERLLMLAAIDRPFTDRLERLLRSDELHRQAGPESLDDGAPWVRASEEGVAWDRTSMPPEPGSAGKPADARVS